MYVLLLGIFEGREIECSRLTLGMCVCMYRGDDTL